MESSLQIQFIRTTQIPADIQQSIDRLDHLAFAGEDPADFPHGWAPAEWMALGCQDGNLVTQLCILRREIRVGDARVWVGGIGGVATDPAWLRQGYGSLLLQAAANFIKKELALPFGLLICANEMQRFYANLGWKTAAEKMFIVKDDLSHPMITPVMIISLADQIWPQGEIDLCGLPW